MTTNIVAMLAAVLATGLTLQAASAMPVTGEPVPELAAFDAAMASHMRANRIKGGALAIMMDGRLVLKHGYGWSGQAQTVPFSPDARVRLASISKAFTAAAIKRSIAQGIVRTNTFAVPFTGIQPYTGRWGDPRFQDMTVGQLIAHKGGWDNNFDHFYTVSEAEELDRPASADLTKRFYRARTLGPTSGAGQ